MKKDPLLSAKSLTLQFPQSKKKKKKAQNKTKHNHFGQDNFLKTPGRLASFLPLPAS